MVDVCHIPQPDFFFNTYLASCQGCISRQCWCVLSHSLPFISTHKLHLQGVKRLIVSLLLISDKGFCHITAPCIFSTVQLPLDSDHGPGWSQLHDPRSAYQAASFSCLRLSRCHFFPKKGPEFIYCNRNYHCRKLYCNVKMVLYC